jgi:hypothetical protein
VPASIRQLGIAVAYALAVALLELGAFTGNDDLFEAVLFVAVSAVFGFAVGEWWGISLALLWPVAGLLNPSEDSGAVGTMYLYAIILVPMSSAALALGIAGRRLLLRRRLRPARHPAGSLTQRSP